MHQIVLPVAGQGQTLGAVALVVGLENIILDLRRLGEGEVAVLAGARGSAPAPLAGMRLLSVSGGEATRSVMQAAQAKALEGPYIRVSRGPTSGCLPGKIPGMSCPSRRKSAEMACCSLP